MCMRKSCDKVVEYTANQAISVNMPDIFINTFFIE